MTERADASDIGQGVSGIFEKERIMKLVTGFFMAWGNFLSLPCPYKKWDNSLKNTMLAFLPCIGGVVGLLAIAFYYILGGLPLSLFVLGYVAYMFGVCGFMHLDGFMDVNDAVLSRRPLEERKRILKDSTTGAFAVISVVLLILAFYVGSETALTEMSVWDLFIIPVVSRSCAGLWVLMFRPMGTSQYLADSEEKSRGKCRMALVIQAIVFVGVATFLNGYLMARTLAYVAIMFGASLVACLFAKKQLDGMNGDIAGYCICVAELAGVLALAIL